MNSLVFKDFHVCVCRSCCQDTARLPWNNNNSRNFQFNLWSLSFSMFSFSWQISRTLHICRCTWRDFAKVSQFMLLLLSFFFPFFTIFFLNVNIRRNISLKVAWKTHLDWASEFFPKAYNHKEKDMFCRWEECVQSRDNVQCVYSLLLLAVLCLSVETAAFSDSRSGVCYAQECACFDFFPVPLYHPCSLSWYGGVFKRPAVFCSLFSKTDFLWWPSPRLFSNRESLFLSARPDRMG